MYLPAVSNSHLVLFRVEPCKVLTTCCVLVNNLIHRYLLNHFQSVKYTFKPANSNPESSLKTQSETQNCF